MKTTNTEKSLKEKIEELVPLLEADTPPFNTKEGVTTPREWAIEKLMALFDSLISQAKREIAKDLDEIHSSFPEDSPSQEWWEATDRLLDYIQNLKSHLTDKK